MPSAYLIVDMQISDLEQYKQYMAEAPAAVKAAGGEYLVRGGSLEVLEGDWQPARVARSRRMASKASRVTPSWPRRPLASASATGACSSFSSSSWRSNGPCRLGSRDRKSVV
jgi:hypothetical protein